jgi:hypothetical protein
MSGSESKKILRGTFENSNYDSGFNKNIEIQDELEREIDIDIDIDTKKQKIEDEDKQVKTIPSNDMCNIEEVKSVFDNEQIQIQSLTSNLENEIVGIIVESAKNSRNASLQTTPASSQNDVVYEPEISLPEGADMYNMEMLNDILSPIETVFKNEKIQKALKTGCGIAIINYIVPYLLPTFLSTGKIMVKHSLTTLSLLVVALRTIGNNSNDNIVEIRKYIMGEITAVLHGLFSVILLTQEIKQETMTEIHNFIVGLKNYKIHIMSTKIREQDKTNVQQDELFELIAKYEEKLKKELKGGKTKSKKQSKKKSKKQSKKKSKKSKKQCQKKSRKQKK